MACKILCAKKENKAEYMSLPLKELWMQCKKQADDLIRRERKGKRKEEGKEEERTADEGHLGVNSDSPFSLLNYLRKFTEPYEARFPHLWNRHNYTYLINEPKKFLSALIKVRPWAFTCSQVQRCPKEITLASVPVPRNPMLAKLLPFSPPRMLQSRRTKGIQTLTLGTRRKRKRDLTQTQGSRRPTSTGTEDRELVLSECPRVPLRWQALQACLRLTNTDSEHCLPVF